ncbi:hypothetical protein Krac_1103 [Ktedonobacter racemifer DSM 44963]|uniref:Uncharacterized protein n=1 Tax=Ktedonobacter racemifer DSM 44963 TaxID=485913 RepID=D6U685_KTERA|nr:hypothetical protein Krac_1103 [Ktedonobacter racemifer DSM 44963]
MTESYTHAGRDGVAVMVSPPDLYFTTSLKSHYLLFHSISCMDYIRKQMFSLMSVFSRLSRFITLLTTYTFINLLVFPHAFINLITSILQYPHTEILFTFMDEEINHFLSHPEKNIQQHFDAFFGSESLQDICSRIIIHTSFLNSTRRNCEWSQR